MYSFGVATCLLSIVVSIRPEVLLLLFRLSSSSVSPPANIITKVTLVIHQQFAIWNPVYQHLCPSTLPTPDWRNIRVHIDIWSYTYDISPSNLFHPTVSTTHHHLHKCFIHVSIACCHLKLQFDWTMLNTCFWELDHRAWIWPVSVERFPPWVTPEELCCY